MSVDRGGISTSLCIGSPLRLCAPQLCNIRKNRTAHCKDIATECQAPVVLTPPGILSVPVPGRKPAASLLSAHVAPRMVLGSALRTNAVTEVDPRVSHNIDFERFPLTIIVSNSPAPRANPQKSGQSPDFCQGVLEVRCQFRLTHHGILDPPENEGRCRKESQSYKNIPDRDPDAGNRPAKQLHHAPDGSTGDRHEDALSSAESPCDAEYRSNIKKGELDLGPCQPVGEPDEGETDHAVENGLGPGPGPEPAVNPRYHGSPGGRSET